MVLTSLNALCVSRWRLILDRASWGLSYACSISPSSSLWLWFRRDFTLETERKNSIISTVNTFNSTIKRAQKLIRLMMWKYSTCRLLWASPRPEWEAWCHVCRTGEGKGWGRSDDSQASEQWWCKWPLLLQLWCRVHPVSKIKYGLIFYFIREESQ